MILTDFIFLFIIRVVYFLWSELIQVQFCFIFIFLFDPSWSESIRVDLVRLLYLPLPMCYFVGNFSCSWILKDCIHVQKEKGEFVVVCWWEFMSSVKCCIRKFHIVIVQWMSKKCTKKSVVLLIKPVVFFFHFLIFIVFLVA